MSFGVLLTVFALIAPAELPDKTFVATLVLATRYPPVPVFIGVTAGFALQSGIAVAAGSLVTLLPDTVVKAISAGIFAIGAVVLLRAGDDPAEEQQAVEAGLGGETVHDSRKVAVTSFLVLFAAEWGDLSQVLTASFTAKYDDPAAVFLGSFLALTAVAALAVTAGRVLMRVVPFVWIRRIAAIGFAVVAVITALQAADVL